MPYVRAQVHTSAGIIGTCFIVNNFLMWLISHKNQENNQT